jgi:hypothetical protein
MNRFPVEMLVYLAIVAAVFLFNYFAQRVAQWQKEQEALRPTERPPEPRRAETLRRAPPVPVSRPAVATTTARAPREALDRSVTAKRRTNVRSYLKGHQNLRRAVIIMTVLGPCRAQQPHDSRH